jgi:CO/xanthine dehydrogenase FAD-binding subunit
VTVTCAITAPERVIESVVIAVGSAGTRVVRAEVASTLHGSSLARLDHERMISVAEAVADASDAVDDANGSAEYKRSLIATLTRRALTELSEAAIP